jgi:Fic family protein
MAMAGQRALFYWAMLRQGYWLFEYISISRLLREVPARYARAFQYTETDDNDLTYFILHQLEVIDRAIRDLHDWLARKAQEMRRLEERIATTRDLNHRQHALLAHALRRPAHR